MYKMHAYLHNYTCTYICRCVCNDFKHNVNCYVIDYAIKTKRIKLTSVSTFK